MSQPSKNYVPTIMIILGATGDLIAKKIIPTLFHLYSKEKLPKLLHIIGFSRRDLSDKAFAEYVLKILKAGKIVKTSKKAEKIEAKKFVKLFSYQRGKFEDIHSYKELAKILGQIDGKWNVCTNKLFYLAVPPKYYETIFKNLAISSLTKACSPGEGWTRILVEKPFGKNLKTAIPAYRFKSFRHKCFHSRR